MSSDVAPESATGASEESGVPDDTAELTARLEVLREENRRLREEYARARQSQYRRSAQTLVVVGLLTLGAGFLFTTAQTVLFALGGTGVFLGVLTYFLTPERFISASVGEEVYASLAHNESQVTAELGLRDERVYVPPDTGELEETRLFVPQHEAYTVPDSKALGDLFVVSDDPHERGISFRPTAADLYIDFADTVSGDPSDEVRKLAVELSDALVEQFELAESAEVDTTDERRIAVRVAGCAMGRVNRFDHPVASLFGVGFARIIDTPIIVDVTPVDDEQRDFIITCSWDPDEETKSGRLVSGNRDW
jgi:hypothetical protein